ncbi:hypothetical protein [Amphibacillus indicireducens]|uniref:Uncharacterized protein n=1 Tax=Amphibacillus indicireducens TaxID=1076330 RepID=A0ABP7V358_9BACI
MKGRDYLKLPKLIMNEVPVQLNPKEKETLDVMKRDLIATIEGENITASNAAAYRWKLRGIAIWSLGQEDMRVWEVLPKQI